jgi:hypothetical protein
LPAIENFLVDLSQCPASCFEARGQDNANIRQ